MNFDTYVFDTTVLNIERPIGVSGLMRVKDDAEFLSLSIDSCIEALDELIIVYQKSNDNSEAIIKEKAKEYHPKIKEYFYEPEIKSHNLTPTEFNSVCNLDGNSVHLLSNYYNYTLSKASFRYALKIDADQIYNTTKLIQICNAYRSTRIVFPTLKERFIGFMISTLSFIQFKLSSRFRVRWDLTPPKTWAEPYYSYELKRIQNKKIPASFNGINIYIKNDALYIPFGKYADNAFPPFNGIDDHLLFVISDKTYYVPSPMHTNHAAYKSCVIERFKYNDEIYKPFGLSFRLANCGFLWFHVAPLKAKFNNENCIRDNILVPFNEGTNKIFKNSLSPTMFNRNRFWFNFWWKSWSLQKKELREQWSDMINAIKLVINNHNDKNN